MYREISCFEKKESNRSRKRWSEAWKRDGRRTDFFELRKKRRKRLDSATETSKVRSLCRYTTSLLSFFFSPSLSLPSYLTIKYDVIRLRVAGIIKREGHAGRQLNSHELCVHEGLRDFCRAFPRRRVFPCNFPDRPSPPLSQWKLTRHDKRKRPRNKRNDNWIPATTKIINRVFCIFSSSSSFLFSVSFFIRYIFNLESIPSILD